MITAWLYWPGLNGDFILDDMPNLKGLLPLETGDKSWWTVFLDYGFGLKDRPVAILTFIGDVVLYGIDSWHMKFTNLVIHLLSGSLIFFLTRRLLLQPVTKVNEGATRWIALWVAAAWLLTPVNVSTTLYVIQRMAQLPALFIFAGLLCYVIGRQAVLKNRTRGFFFIFIAFLVFWPLAVFSKENGIIFPLLAFIVELFFFQPGENHDPLNRKILIALSFLVIIPLVVVTAILVINPDLVLRGYHFRDFSFYERVITQPRILFDYVANMLLIPGGSGMGLFHDDFIKSTGLLTPVTTLFSIIAIMALIVIPFFKTGSRAGIVLFGPLFFLAAHSVESSIFPLELYFEHRNYLPGFGIFFSLGVGGYYLISNSDKKKILGFLMCLIPLSYAGFTYYRVDIWRSWDSILLSSELHHPNSLRVQRGLAIVYIFRGELEKAIAHLKLADELDDQNGDAGISLKYIIAYCYAGKDAPEDIYQRFENLGVFPNDYYTGSVILWFVDSVESGLCRNIDINRIINTLNKHFKNFSFARNYYTNPESFVFMARLLATQGKLKEAIWYLDELLKVKPDSIYAKTLKSEYQSRL